MALPKLHTFKKNIGGPFSNRRVEALEEAYSKNITIVGNIETSITNINSSISTINSTLTSLDSRLDSLEGEIYFAEVYHSLYSGNATGETKVFNGVMTNNSSNFVYNASPNARLTYNGVNKTFLCSLSASVRVPTGNNDFYVKKTGTMIPGSQILSTSSSGTAYINISKTFIVDMLTTDYLEIWLDPSDTGGTWYMEKVILTVTEIK